ncbi:PDZ domain-containing protein [Paenibacillus lutrae]|uniref:PDZ domain-containing protein n=1 Tax=Paenibacillus lutrae TaxID=2078573 RepID=A0A7X3FFY1_9BACL|nr:PDZ domain-containing protein [Paenibacillus lutrae]MVO98862.1 PDZ domain-containing protein [Paenibacillus lutrae]
MNNAHADSSLNVIYLESSLEKVWWSVATVEGTNTYLTYASSTTGMSGEPAVGDIYLLNYGDIENRAQVTECQPCRRFALSDAYNSLAPDGDREAFRVSTSFTLEEMGPFVKLSLSVRGFSGDTSGQWLRECLEMGWRRSLMNLKSVLELGLDLRTELFSYPRLGVTNCTVNTEQSLETGVQAGGGNYLLEVFPGSPAGQAGLRAGDVVTALGGLETGTYSDFVRVISSFYGTQGLVSVTFVREGREQETEVRLSVEEQFTGLNKDSLTLDQIQSRREQMARSRSASGAFWSEERPLPQE